MNKINKIKTKLSIFPFLLVFYEVVTYLSNDAYLPALPEIADNFTIENKSAQLSLTFWFIGTASMYFILGPISDRFGRRPVLLSGGLLFTISTLVCGITNNYNLFLFCRFLEGVSVSTISVAGYACIHEIFEHKKAILYLSIMASITVIAPTLGPLSGSVILYFLNWKYIFLIITSLAFIAVFFLFFYMPEPKNERIPIKPVKIIKSCIEILNIKFIKYTIAICLLFGSMIAWITAGPFFIIEKLKFNQIYFSIIQTMIFSGFIIGVKILKILLNKTDIEKIILFGILITIAAGLSAISLLYLLDNIYGLIISLFIYSIGTGMVFGPLQRLAIESSKSPMGLTMAMFSTFFSSSAAIASILISFFMQNELVFLSYTLFIPSVLSMSILFISK